MAHNDRFEYLLMQKQSGAITLPEQLELSELIKQDETFAYMADAMDEVFSSHLKYDIESQAVNEALFSLNRKIHGEKNLFIRKSSRIKRLLPAIAASLIFLVAATFLINKTLNKDSPAPVADNVFITRKGSKTSLILPDGTKAWLNADSRLNYNEDYGIKNREVSLVGEAYFDVVKNKAIPFIVHTSTIEVKVLGTAFNVRAYANEKSTEATLVKGAIEVVLKRKSSKNTIILKPSEKIVVQNTLPDLNTGVSAKMPIAELFSSKINEKDTTTRETEWTKNRLVFEQETLENVITTLERWYNVTIEVQKTTRFRLYNGTFENDRLEDVLESLKNVGNFNYKIEKEKNTVFIF
ncbi:FecR family protein [Filimonas effusa]|uniref:FecR family protein n=1 Tax=Filimonas effusa TaxID=2508721 RepID=A0A4Q1D888_9BACT|nr:FecR family protein [Filimonas effusa]RXK85481.1 FecR family protein [Filimonas effusa]